MLGLLLFFLVAPGPAHAWEVKVELPEGMEPADLRGPHIGFSEGGHGRVRHVQVDHEGLQRLHELGLTVNPVPPPPDAFPDRYHTPDEMEDALKALADAHPDIVQLVELGNSRQGRPILAVRLSTSQPAQVAYRVLGAHHGDELISAEVALDFAQTLAEGELHALPLGAAVWIVPHVNPDGVAEQRRANAWDVDLNRNYAYEWSDQEYRPGEWAFSEPETRAIQALAVRSPPVLGISLHSGATNFGWVWNHTTSPSPDASSHEVLGEIYAETCTTPGFWVTNGASWYPTNGDTNDWSYGDWGTFDYTVEVSTDKTPPPGEVDAHLDHHREALLALFADTPIVYGQLVDAEDGRPIRGTVRATSGGQPRHTSDDGRFAVVEVETDLELLAMAPGYATRRIQIGEGESVALERIDDRATAEVWPPVMVGGQRQNLTIELEPPSWAARCDARPGNAGRQKLEAGGDSTSSHPLDTAIPQMGTTSSVEPMHRLERCPVLAVAFLPPGRPKVSGAPTRDGIQLDLTSHPPGLWLIEANDRLTTSWLLVDGPDAPAIVRHEVTARTLVVELEKGSAGREIWVYVDGRLARQADVPTTSPVVHVDLAQLDPHRRVDVAVVGSGGPVWVADVFSGAWTASHRPPGTVSVDRGLVQRQETMCACAATPWNSAPLFWPFLLGLIRRRPS